MSESNQQRQELFRCQKIIKEKMHKKNLIILIAKGKINISLSFIKNKGK